MMIAVASLEEDLMSNGQNYIAAVGPKLEVPYAGPGQAGPFYLCEQHLSVAGHP